MRTLARSSIKQHTVLSLLIVGRYGYVLLAHPLFQAVFCHALRKRVITDSDTLWVRLTSSKSACFAGSKPSFSPLFDPLVSPMVVVLGAWAGPFLTNIDLDILEPSFPGLDEIGAAACAGKT